MPISLISLGIVPFCMLSHPLKYSNTPREAGSLWRLAQEQVVVVGGGVIGLCPALSPKPEPKPKAQNLNPKPCAQ